MAKACDLNFFPLFPSIWAKRKKVDRLIDQFPLLKLDFVFNYTSFMKVII